MTSLTDVYEGEVGRVASRRQQFLGTGLFLAGAAGLVGAIALATTGVGEMLGLQGWAHREVAGIVAGLGLPAVILGVFTVLPAGPRTRATAVTGATIAVIGVAVFQHIYPYTWVHNAPLLTLSASTVYIAGVLTTFWCLFAALATVKTRSDPGGTAEMRVTEEGTIELVEESRSIPGLGGIGLFGTDPDGSVETQTNRRDAGRSTVSDGGDGSEVMTESTPQPEASDPTSQPSPTPQGPSERELDSRLANAGPEASHSTDGGTTPHTGQDPITETALHQGEPDSYCGNCRHFQYVMDGDDIEPYCTFHEEMLDDMEACSAWVDNG
jgi:cytochrome c biogenesis protein CcdA